MPNIKSAKKRVLVSKANNERNKMDKSELKTTLKKFDAAVAAGDQCQLATACRGEGRGSVRGDRSGGVAELRGEDVPRRGARGAGRFGELCGARVASVVFSVAGRRIQRDSADAERDPVAAGRAAQLHRVS